jgi:hypothetical protein
VTHVAEVAINSRSINGTGCTCEIGSDKKNVPHVIVHNTESKTVRPGEEKRALGMRDKFL